jgi:hypothetical protein
VTAARQARRTGAGESGTLVPGIAHAAEHRMAYSDFTLPELVKRFGLTLVEQRDLFATTPEQEPGDLLRANLIDNVPLALAIGTEKARSELIIMPVLVEMRRLLHRSVAIFSGLDFTVDPANGLNGVCDFIVSRSPEQYFIASPVMTIIEAKNENIKAGIGQCGAAMVAAQRFNEREGTGITTIYGAVTTGNTWRFLMLDGHTLFIDQPEYYIERIEKILGIFIHAVQPAPASTSA